MNIQTLTLGPLATNCYLVRQDGCSRVVIIDPAANSKKLLAALQEQGLTLEAIFLTHAHFDHIGALKTCTQRHRRPSLSARPTRTTRAICATICCSTPTPIGRVTSLRPPGCAWCSRRPDIRRGRCACCAKTRCFRAIRSSPVPTGGRISPAAATRPCPRP